MTRPEAHSLVARYDSAREGSRRLMDAAKALGSWDEEGAQRLGGLALDAHKQAEELLALILAAMATNAEPG